MPVFRAFCLLLAAGRGWRWPNACTRAPDPGYLQLQRSRDAIREASSWQSDVLVQNPSGQPMILELSKVECPGRMEVTSILHDMHNISVREIWLDGTYYNKTENVGVWVSHPANLNPFPQCGRGPIYDRGRACFTADSGIAARRGRDSPRQDRTMTTMFPASGGKWLSAKGAIAALFGVHRGERSSSAAGHYARARSALHLHAHAMERDDGEPALQKPK